MTERLLRFVTTACKDHRAVQGICLWLPGVCTIARSLLFCVKGKRAVI